MLVIYETTFEEWVKRRHPPEEHRLRVLDFLAEVADGTTELNELVQVPNSAAFQAHLTVGDSVILVELLRGDVEWCVVSYIGGG